MPPSVSVVLPCYNHQQYVRTALESVLAQTLEDIEIIAIDDGSEDETARILEGFDDPRLTLVRHEENRGSAQTINEGIRRAKAPYVAILNSDDLYHPERLAHCLEYATKHDALLLGTDLELIGDSGEVIRDRTSQWIEWYRELMHTYRLSGDLTATLISGNLFITTSNFFFQRSLFDSIGPLSDYRYVQDYEFLLRASAAHPQQLHWLEQRLLSYRLHESNTIRDDVLGPNQQTLEILTHWMPELAVGERAAERLRLFETHLLKLAGHIERASADKVHTQWQADAANFQRILGERDHAIEAFSAERERTLEAFLAERERTLEAFSAEREHTLEALSRARTRVSELESDIKAVYASASYRLGHKLLQPLRWIRHWWGGEKT